MDITDFTDNCGIGGDLSNGQRQVSEIEGDKNES